jgi:hypothetical protein
MALTTLPCATALACDRIVNIWNDSPYSIVMASTVSLFKRRLRNFDFSAYIMY